ncbi:MAG: glycosyltransferase family 39 protein [Acidobacteriota bacterium]|nr:glycosyltransferase family 39 protein [Acidobacteriota bacterium]
MRLTSASPSLHIPWILAGLIFLAHELWIRALALESPYRILAAALVTSVQIVVSQIALGMFDHLTGPALLLTNLVIAAAFLMGYGFWARKRIAQAPASPRARPSFVGGLLGALVAVTYGFILYLERMVPPHDVDSLNYHLLDVLTYAHNRNLDPFPFAWIQPYFPKAGELLTLWIYLLGGGNKAAFVHMNTVQIPFAFMGGWAVWSLAHAFGLRHVAVLALSLYVLTPLVLLQSLTTMVDIIAAAFFLTALVFLVLHLQNRRSLELHLFALAFGLLLGTKFTFLYLSLPLIVVFLFGADRGEFPLGEHLRLVWSRVGTLLLCVLLGGGFWMVRNALVFGNPVYPVRLEIAGTTLFDGPISMTRHSELHERRFVSQRWQWLFYPFREAYVDDPRFHTAPEVPIHYGWSNGFGPQFAMGGIATLLMLVRARRRRDRLLFWTLMTLPLSIALWWILNPYREPRYILAICGIAIFALLVLRSELTRFGRAFLTGALVIAAFFSVLATTGHLVERDAGSCGHSLVHLLRSGRFGPDAIANYPLVKEYGPAIDGLVWIADHIRNRTIAYTVPDFAALLYGWESTNRPVHIPTWEFVKLAHLPRATTYAEWRRLLAEQRVDYIFFYNPPTYDAPYPVAEWIRAHPEDFEVVKSWGPTVALLRPRFSSLERANVSDTSSGWPVGRSVRELPELNDPLAWQIYLEVRGCEVTRAAADGGVRLSWRFTTRENDYGEILAGVELTEWSAARWLEFQLFWSGAPDLLFVYVKNLDPRQYARFRLPLRTLAPGWNRVRIDLTRPEWKTNGFTLGDVRTLHLVVDDDPDERIGTGEIIVRDFRLAREGS